MSEYTWEVIGSLIVLAIFIGALAWLDCWLEDREFEDLDKRDDWWRNEK